MAGGNAFGAGRLRRAGREPRGRGPARGGFTAIAEGDQFRVDEHELEMARWFTREELLASPEDESFRLPRRDSIARRLVDDWIAGRR